jgi:hypothetical protein
MATMQMIFKNSWPMAQEIRRPGEILFEGVCPIKGATPGMIAKAVMFDAVEIRVVEEKKTGLTIPAEETAEHPAVKTRGKKK